VSANTTYPEACAGGAAPRGVYAARAKRLFDIVAAACMLLLVAPLVMVLAWVVRRDGGPAFHRQERVGRHGRTFMCWKLRSMQPNAEQLLAEHLEQDPAAAAEWARDQKLRHDPRITRPGRVLRKYSLDELPQLANVLLGDMSLVGPRPMMPQQMELYPGRSYTALRPGVTGFWQVSDRNRTSFAARARYDDRYLAEVSLYTDIRVMLQTVQVVLRGTGV
jgi:exopolysaccharide production protein ExoY